MRGNSRQKFNLLIQRCVDDFRMIWASYGQMGLIEASAAFLTYFIVMGQNGFLPKDLLGIRSEWDSPAINNLFDSYGQEWVSEAQLLSPLA